MKNFKYIILSILTFSILSCEIEEQVDPNSPSLSGVEQNATTSQLNNLVTGALFQMRDQVNVYADAIGVIGRDMYRFSGSDPRWVADLINGTLDNNAFYTTRPFSARYRTVKNLNILIDAVKNTSTISDAERDGYIGFAQTLMAHEFLMILNLQNANGIRIDVKDPENLGPFVTKDEAFTEIDRLLTEGLDRLNGAEFAFILTSGFNIALDGEGNPDPVKSYMQFNNAIAARVAVYRNEYADALTKLTNSFFDLDGNYDAGAYMVFSSSAGDLVNPLFLPKDNTGEVRVAHPDWVTDAEAGDKRLSKATARTAEANKGPGPASASGLTSNFDSFIYTSNTAPVGIIRNEELVLIYAEASIQTMQLGNAVIALNNIRNNAGLPDYTGVVDQPSLINEMLRQRRYSLWNEGHRWIDARRYDKLGELSIDRVGDIVHTEFPTPFDEIGAGG